MLRKNLRIPSRAFPGVLRAPSISDELFRVVFKKDNTLPESRFAVIVSQKNAKNTVTRNRIRRLVYMATKHLPKEVPKGFFSIFPQKTQFTKEEAVQSLSKLIVCLKK